MRKWSGLGALLLGAGLMYALDPASGKRRRRRAVEGSRSLGRRSRELSKQAARKLGRRAHDLSRGIHARGMDSMVREIGHRVHDLAHEIDDRRREATQVFEDAPDGLVIERVRSKLGHLVAHPDAVDVNVEGGRVILCGNVLPDESRRLLSTIASIPGVRHVENRLRVTDFPGRGPSSRSGKARRFRLRVGALDTPVTRVALGVLSVMIAVFSIRRMRGASGGEAVHLGRPIAAEMIS